MRERLTVSKRAAKKIDMERFNVKKLNEGDVKEQYKVTIRNKFAALQNVEDSGYISGAWEDIRKNIKISAEEYIGYCEPRHYKLWFDEECSELVDRRKQAKLQWLQAPRKGNEDDLSNAQREASRHFRKKKREYLKDRINKLESNIKSKSIEDLYRGTNEFKKGYQPRTNLLKDERGDLFVDPQTFLNRWKYYFCQLLNIHRAGVLGGPKCIQPCHLCQCPVPLSLRLLLGSGKGIYLQVLIRFQQDCFRQEGKHCIRRSINLLS
jgi:hypothetical protein